MPYLLKTEPGTYSIEDLARDGETVWDGVTAPAAVKFLAGMKRGEMLVIYHTGTERRSVGIAKVVNVDASDVKTPLVRLEVRKADKNSAHPGRNKGAKFLREFAPASSRDASPWSR